MAKARFTISTTLCGPTSMFGSGGATPNVLPIPANVRMGFGMSGWATAPCSAPSGVCPVSAGMAPGSSALSLPPLESGGTTFMSRSGGVTANRTARLTAGPVDLACGAWSDADTEDGTARTRAVTKETRIAGSFMVSSWTMGRNDEHGIARGNLRSQRRGRPTGPFLRGTARVVESYEEAHANAALRGNYRWLDRLYERAADRLPVEP